MYVCICIYVYICFHTPPPHRHGTFCFTQPLPSTNPTSIHQKGLRDTVFHSLFGRTLVFDTKEHALEYRSKCTKVLQAVPTIITEDGCVAVVVMYGRGGRLCVFSLSLCLTVRS